MSNNPITIPSKIPLIYYHNLHNLQNLAKCEDPRLNLTEIPKGLIELLQTNDFTINKILDSKPSDIAERLGIDSCVGEIIYKETEKAISKINHNNL
jgi:hypothetical protein